jgi:hypothetical protein
MVAPSRSAGLAERRVPQIARRGFERLMRPACARGDVHALDLDWQPKPRGQRTAELLIGFSFLAAKLMVDVNEPGDGRTAGGGKIAQHEHEGDRI